MEIINKLEEICGELDLLQDYTDNLANDLSYADSKRCDLEHFIEHNKINSKNSYRICKEMQKVLLERRKIKNDMELNRVMTINFNKLISKDHRKFLLAEIKKTNGKLNKPYNNRVYTKEYEDYLLGKEDTINEELEKPSMDGESGSVCC
jgi:hypothetical protein